MEKFNFNSIFKRSRCLTSNSDKIDSEKPYKILEANIQKNINNSNLILDKRIFNNYLESMYNRDNASNNYYKFFEIAQTLTEARANNNDLKFVITEFSNRVLPYVEDLNSVIESVERYTIPLDYIEFVKEEASNYLLADKILNNHKQISKRFNIENEIVSFRSKGVTHVVERCYSMIDTYNIKLYQKFNMCIEEMVYLLEKNKISYDQNELVLSILEEFLLKNPKITKDDIKGFKFSLENNRCVDSIYSAYNLITEDYNSSTINSCIKNFYKNTDKTINLYRDQLISTIENTSISDVKNSYKSLLEFTYKVYTSGLFEDEEIKEATEDIMQSVFNKCNYVSTGDDFREITRNNIMDFIDTTKVISAKIPLNSITDDLIVRRTEFKNILNDNISKCYELSNILYNKTNIKNIDFVNEDKDEVVSLQEFKIFKFNNLIRATKNLDKYIGKKVSKIRNKIVDKARRGFNKIKNILFDESGNYDKESIYSFIGEDSKVDICVYQIEMTSEKEIEEIQEELIDICQEYNFQLDKEDLDNIRCYYILNGCVAELHLKDSTKLELTEEDWKMVSISENPSSDVYIEQLGLFDACNNIAENFQLRSLDESLISLFSSNDINMNLESYDVAMDALS